MRKIEKAKAAQRSLLRAEEVLENLQEERYLPPTYKAGRGVNIQLASLQQTLFTALEEAESPNYIVYELRRSVKEVDFAAFTFAVTQTLYNQSYLKGNEDTNSGLERTIDKALQRQTGQTFFGGTIATTLKDLCRLAYGVEEPDVTQKKKIASIIDILKNNPLPISIPIVNDKGEKDRIRLKDTLAFPIREGERESDKAKFFVLYLHPIFCNLADGFLEAPQDLTKQLTAVVERKTAAHYHLLRLLLLQKKSNTPFVRYTDTLLEELGLTEAYQDQATRTEKQLLSICEDMKKIGIITEYEVERGRRGRRRNALIKISFHLNPNYIRKQSSATPQKKKRKRKK